MDVRARRAALEAAVRDAETALANAIGAEARRRWQVTCWRWLQDTRRACRAAAAAHGRASPEARAARAARRRLVEVLERDPDCAGQPWLPPGPRHPFEEGA